jgi:thiamine kinase-like enzyme
MGNCHGDFTFSNMIVSENGDICLIDFLETFLETPLQDIAKLMQELKYYWSLRYLSSPCYLKAKTSAAWMLSNSQVVARAYCEHPIAMKVLEIMCIARIAPYVKDDCTMTWLIWALNQSKEI